MAEDKNSLPPRTPRRDPYRLTGETFGGRYQLEEFAGMGSFGAVYRAKDMRVGRTVAVKILKPDLGDDETAVARELFQREALTAGRLMHPHIVAVTDVGEDSGFAYLVMEWLEGRTLEDELRNRTPFSLEETRSLLAPIADALSTAHDAGIIHRDIKPSNIYIGRRDRPFVKVLDFGIAKVVSTATAATASRIAGTASYMSPEQITGSRIDRRTDLYSLGIVLYQMLTGELPFKGESQGHIIQQHLAASPPWLAEVRPDLPHALSQVIGRALGKLPEARQQSAQELYAEFAAALTSKAVSQSAHRSLPSHEQVTEVISGDAPPTVWAGHFAAPQPSPNVAQLTAPVLGSTIESLHPSAVPPATAETKSAELTRMQMVSSRAWTTILFFALVGAIVFSLSGILTLLRKFHSLYGIRTPNFAGYTATALAFFGFLLGVTISPLRWSKRVLYYALVGAGTFLLLSVFPRWRLYNPDSTLLILVLLHNVLVGAALGLAACALRFSIRLNQRAKALLISGTASAVIALLFSYFLYLPQLYFKIFYNSLDDLDYLLKIWLICAIIGFAIGLIICGLRVKSNKSV